MEALLSTRIGARAPVQRGNAADKGIQTRLSSNFQGIPSRICAQGPRKMQICAAMQHQGTGGLQLELNETTTIRNAPLELTQRLVANMSDAASLSTSWTVVGVLAAAALLASPEVALAAQASDATSFTAHPIADIAENTDFWANVLRYISYFFSVLLGTAYVAIQPIINLLKRPTTAILVIIGGAALYFFVSTTVGAMLGMNDIIDYEPSSIVTPQQ